MMTDWNSNEAQRIVRLAKAIEAGRSGLNLVKMDKIDVLKILSRPPPQETPDD